MLKKLALSYLSEVTVWFRKILKYNYFTRGLIQQRTMTENRLSSNFTA